MTRKNVILLIILLFTIIVLTRFYNLNWGAPFYFHPDERNIASSVSQLQFPDQMNPHFFAYGSLPIYVIYFTGILVNCVTQLPYFFVSGLKESVSLVKFEQAIQISRFFSAGFSLFLIPLLYLLGKKLKDTRTGILAAILTTFSTGFIQYAHFGTFEMWLTILSVLLFLFVLDFKHEFNLRLLIFAALVFGAAISTKITHLVLLPVPLAVIAYYQFYRIKKAKLLIGLKIFLHRSIFFGLITIAVFLITNPFVFIDYSSFVGSMNYESGVALGTLPVFYTGEFMNAIPVLFQFLHVYPFLINPLLTVLFIAAFIYLVYKSIRTKNKKYILLIIMFLILFLSQTFLYVKWVRYLVPTLPFVYLIIAIALVDLWKYFLHFKTVSSIKYLILCIIIGICVLFSVSYFVTAFVEPDTRLAAAEWAKIGIPTDANIISEVYDLGITPYNSSFTNITLFNYYDLEHDPMGYNNSNLDSLLLNSDYIILPSQRILKVRLQDLKNFPNGHNFYSRLFNGLTDFKKIYETPCDLFCRIIYLNNPVGSFEETASVFDRPTVYIFRKQ